MGGGKAYLLFLAQSTHRLVQADTAMGNFDFEEFMQRPKTKQLNNIQQQQTPEFYCSILNRLTVQLCDLDHVLHVSNLTWFHIIF